METVLKSLPTMLALTLCACATIPASAPPEALGALVASNAPIALSGTPLIGEFTTHLMYDGCGKGWSEQSGVSLKVKPDCGKVKVSLVHRELVTHMSDIKAYVYVREVLRRTVKESGGDFLIEMPVKEFFPSPGETYKIEVVVAYPDSRPRDLEEARRSPHDRGWFYTAAEVDVAASVQFR